MVKAAKEASVSRVAPGRGCATSSRSPKPSKAKGRSYNFSEKKRDVLTIFSPKFMNVPLLLSLHRPRGVGEVLVGLDVRPEILEVLRQDEEIVAKADLVAHVAREHRFRPEAALLEDLLRPLLPLHS